MTEPENTDTSLNEPGAVAARCRELIPLVRILETHGIDAKLETFLRNTSFGEESWGIRVVAKRTGTTRQFIHTTEPASTVEFLVAHIQQHINDFFHR